MSEDIIIKELVHELLKKFVSTLAAIFTVQELDEFKEFFPAKQKYHFAILDVQTASDEDTDYRGSAFNRAIQDDLEDTINEFSAQIDAIIAKSSAATSGATSIGHLITSYSELYNSIKNAQIN